MKATPIILIANRGEIACRVIATAKKLGITTVAVYSDADAHARHVSMADRSIGIGPGPAAESYLRADKILAACVQSGATMVHPGYGFLSENASFSKACREAGFKFIGPSPESIEGLGNKSAGKALAESLGVPCLPGYRGTQQSTVDLAREALKIGFPLMIKAAAGGGGRGMRRVDHAEQLEQAIDDAKLEAMSGFGSDQLLIERLVERARHIEIQVLGDQHGQVVHLGERDCSTQRRNQKILEEAPAPGLSHAVRQAMGEAAIKLAKGVSYEGAGTIEFLLEGDDRFYFLEMNTRLQVEHPVTEAVTGLDLVALQIAVAQGQSLTQLGIDQTIRGHAIEARLCAEDAFAGFIPQPGAIAAWRFPYIEGVRIDHGLSEKPEIPRFYDSMIAKLIAHGPNREVARQRLIAALEQTHLLGIKTNRDYLLACLRAEPFVEPRLSTRWLDEHAAQFTEPKTDDVWGAVAAALRVHHAGLAHGSLAHWSNKEQTRIPVRQQCTDRSAVNLVVHCRGDTPGTFTVLTPGEELALTPGFAPGSALGVTPQPGIRVHIEPGAAVADLNHLKVDGLTLPVFARLQDQQTLHLDIFGVSSSCKELSASAPDKTTGATGNNLIAKMHGMVRGLGVVLGQSVKLGDRLLSLEAMKMEHSMNAPCNGTIKAIHVQEALQVTPGKLLIEIEPDSVV
jgi:geranyl-CoA carboxylase alpha subunit